MITIDNSILKFDSEKFDTIFITLMREKDEVGIRQIGYLIEEEIIKLWKGIIDSNDRAIISSTYSSIDGLLDKLMICGSSSLRYQHREILGDIINHYYEVYKLGLLPGPKYKGTEGHFTNSRLWKDVMLRVYVLGALSIYSASYDAAKIIADKPWLSDESYESENSILWARHALTMLARENALKEKSLCTAAEKLAMSNEYIYRYFRGEKVSLQKSLAQYDIFQCIVGMMASSLLQAVYPSYSIYPKKYIEPLVADLISSGQSRNVLGNISNKELAGMIKLLDNYADKENFTTWTKHWSNSKISELLDISTESDLKKN